VILGWEAADGLQRPCDIVPYPTSAVCCCAVCVQVIPELNGKLTGMAFRVPTQVSCAAAWLLCMLCFDSKGAYIVLATCLCHNMLCAGVWAGIPCCSLASSICV
jgi:hypothetical protein